MDDNKDQPLNPDSSPCWFTAPTWQLAPVSSTCPTLSASSLLGAADLGKIRPGPRGRLHNSTTIVLDRVGRRQGQPSA
jgi:hypothetical protein